MALLVALGILLSAGTYLFDFGSNMVIVIQYSKNYTKYLHLKESGTCDDFCRHQSSELAGYFWGMVGILVCSHTLNAVIFKFKFKKKDSPFRAAYFLPLIHLWRLGKLLWNTLSCHGASKLRSEEMNGLFNMMGMTFEGIPLLILQFSAYLVLVKTRVFDHGMPTIFKVSVAASLVSAAYNGGSSIQSVAENAKTLKQKLGVAFTAGLFTLFATIARCLSYTDVMVRMREHFQRGKSQRYMSGYHATDLIPIIFLVLHGGSYWLFYWVLQFPREFHKRLHNLRKCFACLAFGYMSLIAGPLYPLVSEARDMGELGTGVLHCRVLIVVGLNMLVDMSTACVTYRMGTLPVAYLVISLVAAAGSFLSAGLYVKLDKKYGGLARSGIVQETTSNLMLAQGADLVVGESTFDHHQIIPLEIEHGEGVQQVVEALGDNKVLVHIVAGGYEGYQGIQPREVQDTADCLVVLEVLDQGVDEVVVKDVDR